jgi:UDP-3-O-[3-hydroxymyristoyl] glucosamine N-acyltransferase
VLGDVDRMVSGVATLEAALESDLAFLANPKYRKAAETTRAGALLVGPGERITGRDLLEVGEPYPALARILALFHPPSRPRAGVSPDARLGRDVEVGAGVHVAPFAVIGDGCVLAPRVSVGAGTVVGADCTIGEDTVLAPRVVLYPGTRVGARCLLHAGVVLGADGFGFATTGGEHLKVPQVGRVVVEDDVEIGANSTVDRGALGDTLIGRGTKIDDLVMIAHGVQVGPGCLLVAQSGIAGSTRIGAHVTFAGQSGAAGHLDIGAGTVVAAKSAVFEDVPAGSFVAGIPAGDHRAWKRSQAATRKLPDLRREVGDLRRRLAALEADRPQDE